MSEHREHQQPPTLTVITPYCEDCRGGPKLTHSSGTKLRMDLTKRQSEHARQDRSNEPKPRPYTSPVYSHLTNTQVTKIDKPPPPPDGDAAPVFVGLLVVALITLGMRYVWRKVKGAFKRHGF